MQLIKINGKLYNVLGCYGGNIHLGHPTDVNNEVILSGTIWYLGRWTYDIPKYQIIAIRIVRMFKKDTFGQREIITKLKKLY